MVGIGQSGEIDKERNELREIRGVMTSETSRLIRRAAFSFRQFQISSKTSETALFGEEVTPERTVREGGPAVL